MRQYFIGHHHGTKKKVHLPRSSFDTHYHLIGGTGKGKTTLIHTIIHELMLDPTDWSSLWLIDKLGGLSNDLLLWMASDYCPQEVRDRLVYIEPSREDVVMPFNPLLYATPGEGYYKVSRAMEIILRGWAASMQSLDETPRAARWMWNSFWGVAQLGLAIADCFHLLMPNSEHHSALIKCLPQALQEEWKVILKSHNGEDLRLLESTQNRLHPYFYCPPLKNIFNASESKLDVLRFMREGKVVLFNLAPYGKLPERNANAIGGLVLNEILNVARSLPDTERYPLHLILDEFQNYVGPDIEAAIPEVRQLGIKLWLSHQSFSQLKRGDCDLSSIIFQAQSRAIFGLQGLDADIVAQELASLTFDPYRIKDEIYSRRQKLTGHRIIDLQSSSFSQQEAANWSKNFGRNWSANEAMVRRLGSYDLGTQSRGLNRGGTESEGEGGSRGTGMTQGTHQTLVPIHEDVEELARRTFFTFDEYRNIWARDIRKLARGITFLRLVDDPTLYHIDVKRSAPGPLAWDARTIKTYLPELLDAREALKEKNFQSEFFQKPHEIERQAQERIQRVLHPVIRVQIPKEASDTFT